MNAKQFTPARFLAWYREQQCAGDDEAFVVQAIIANEILLRSLLDHIWSLRFLDKEYEPWHPGCAHPDRNRKHIDVMMALIAAAARQRQRNQSDTNMRRDGMKKRLDQIGSHANKLAELMDGLGEDADRCGISIPDWITWHLPDLLLRAAHKQGYPAASWRYEKDADPLFRELFDRESFDNAPTTKHLLRALADVSSSAIDCEDTGMRRISPIPFLEEFEEHLQRMRRTQEIPKDWKISGQHKETLREFFSDQLLG